MPAALMLSARRRPQLDAAGCHYLSLVAGFSLAARHRPRYRQGLRREWLGFPADDSVGALR